MGEKKVDTSNKLSYQFPYSLQKIFINLGAKYNYSTAAVFFFPPSLLQHQAKSQVFILARNRSTSLHSNREQLLAATLYFKVLSTSLRTSIAVCV